jgi:hypothetical protein
MKVTLDLDRLLADGAISPEEYARLQGLAARSTTNLAFNLLVGFGIIAVSVASLALVPTSTTALILGALVGGGGGILHARGGSPWRLLAQMAVVIGVLLMAGGIVAVWGAGPESFLAVALLFALAGIRVHNPLLIVLSVLALGAALGARTGYFHAMYWLGIREPTLTILVFAALAGITEWITAFLPLTYHRLVRVGARTSVFLVNFGFWIGSLWGDEWATGSYRIPDGAFAVAWAIALLATGLWAWRHNRRGLLNVTAVFAAIHLYTQWFERLGAQPETVLLAGLMALGLALGLRALNTALARG